MGLLDALFPFAAPPPAQAQQPVMVPVPAPPPPKESLPPVRYVPRPQLTYPNYGAQGVMPPDLQKITPEELQAAAEKLGIFDNQGKKPKFDISDLSQNRGEMLELLKNQPLDIRPLASFVDTVYGTNITSRTPNYRADSMEQLKQLQGLMGDSPALQQVKGQARLEEFKQQLEATKDLGPVEKARVYDYLSKGLRAGSGSDLSLLKLQNAMAERNDAQRDRNQETNRLQSISDRDMLFKAQEKWLDNKAVSRYQNVKGSAERVRNLVYAPAGGVPDYGTVTAFIKTLDPDSTVMFNEAAGVYKARGLIDQIRQKPDEWLSGARLSPAQIESILLSIDRFETKAKEAYEKARLGERKRATSIGLNPDDVTVAVDEAVGGPEQTLIYEDDKNEYHVPVSQRGAFEKQHKTAKRRGTQ